MNHITTNEQSLQKIPKNDIFLSLTMDCARRLQDQRIIGTLVGFILIYVRFDVESFFKDLDNFSMIYATTKDAM